MFEICSLKLYKNNGFDVHFELTDEYDYILQTEEELIPFNKKILFQIHFRPNIIYNDDNKTIEKKRDSI